jgi:hypothetical protein
MWDIQISPSDNSDDGKGDDELRVRCHTTKLLLLRAILLCAKSTTYYENGWGGG